MKMDQIAFYCYSKEAEDKLKRTLCVSDWIEDEVVCNNIIYPAHGVPYLSKAIGHLQFNYQLGVEVEILRYKEGSSWHNHLPTGLALRGTLCPFISHIGIHTTDLPDKENMMELGWRLVQETKTLVHTNPYLIEKRRTYEYQIWESVPGSYLKYIKRNEA
jgi:hypothetical protein